MDIDNITYDDTKLEDLNFFWTKSGVPCFMADRDNIEEIVENLGFNIYYLICNVATDRKVETKSVGYANSPSATTTTYVTDYATNIVKIVNNFVGRSVSIVKDEDIYDFSAVREDAEYSLPSIPYDIVTKLDEFFRLVEAQHGTESIVLLTFDPSKSDSSGWGVLVPDQVNTSVHCKYDAESIVDQKPEDVMIVGSVHSHPNMAAYASGTDHADQADFDGLHITYGWQKSVNGGATQYHIEMQIGGAIWTLKPEDVFEDFIFNKNPDPQVLEWSQKVKKVLPPTGGTPKPLSTPLQSTQQPATTTQVASIQTGAITDKFRVVGNHNYQQYPDQAFQEAVDSQLAMFIIEIDYTESDPFCYACAGAIGPHDLYNQVCPICDIMFCDLKDNVSDILSSARTYLTKRNKPINIDYYLWSIDDKSEEIFYKIAERSFDQEDTLPVLIVEEDEYPVQDNIDEYYYSGFNPDRTVCCNIHIRDIELCTCQQTIVYEDILDFDFAHPYDVYARNNDCIHCIYYYSRECTPYRTAIVDFVSTKTPMQNSISVCSDWTEYNYDQYVEKGYLYD